MTGIAYRVPTNDVSVIDVNIQLKESASYEEICRKIKEASEEGPMKGVIEYIDDEVVSSDFIADPHTSIFDAQRRNQLNDKFFKLIAFYDNEYGYSTKVLELIRHMYHVDNAEHKKHGARLSAGREGGIRRELLCRKQKKIAVGIFVPTLTVVKRMVRRNEKNRERHRCIREESPGTV